MKNKIFSFAIVMMGFSATSFAQSSATATSTATLITPISVVVANNMDFGTIAASATGGTVILDTATNTRTATGGVFLQSGGATPQVAVFTVTGEVNQSFTITGPTSIDLTSGANTLALALTGVTSPSVLDGAGNATIKIGGTLTVPAAAPAGIYANSTDLTVTVNYN